MKVGVFSVLLSSEPFESVLDYFCGIGVQAVEVGTGAYPGNAHCDPDALLRNDRKCSQFVDAIKSRDLVLSSLSCHGNPLHPNRAFARKHDEIFRKKVQLAKKSGHSVVTTFSGAPGGHPGAKQPNWVTCSWPPDYLKVLDYQWKKVAIPYWKKTAAFAAKNGVKVAFEMHPGFIVYNPETLLKLRKACGNNLGANSDPSHLFWQGIDPNQALRLLKGAVYHVHAKDTAINTANVLRSGVLDTKHYGDELNRSWIFRTVGYGHGREFWNEFVSTLRMIGYDGALSIEHEDSLMSPREGLEKAVAFLNEVIIHQKKGALTWA